MDFRAMQINLIDDATIETLKRLFAGLDIDEYTPCVRQGSEIIPIRSIEIDGNRVIFDIY
jgi:hypothetical protein